MKQYKTFHKLQLEENFEFKVGDIVSFGGVITEVHEVDRTNQAYPVRILVGITHASFTLDGRYGVLHKEPTLILVERSRKIVEKTIEAHVSDYAIKLFQNGENIDTSLSIATQLRPKQMNKIKITYEVEE